MDLALDNPQWLMCHKIKLNQTNYHDTTNYGEYLPRLDLLRHVLYDLQISTNSPPPDTWSFSTHLRIIHLYVNEGSARGIMTKELDCRLELQ